MTAYTVGATEHARASASVAAALVDALPDGELARRLDAVVWLGWMEIFVDRLADADRHLGRGLELARSTGRGFLLGQLLVGLGILRTWQGRPAEAVARFDDAIEAALLARDREFEGR